MKTSGRLRISIGILLVLMTAGLFAESTPAPDCSLAVASGSNWRTDLFLYNAGTEPVTFRLEECRIAPCLEYRLEAGGGALRVRNVGTGFGLISNMANAITSTFLRYDDGQTNQSYAVPCLWPLQGGETRTVGPIVNDGDLVTTVNVLGVGRVEVEIFDGSMTAMGAESFDSAGVMQYQVKTPVLVGSLRITARQTVGCPGCTTTVHGFVSVTDRRGGNARILPF